MISLLCIMSMKRTASVRRSDQMKAGNIMLTIEALREYGANVEEGLKRCVNNEKFYLSLVQRAVKSAGTDELESALAGGDLHRAFEICHSMKGVFGNLSLTPLYAPVSEMTELLRAEKAADYKEYLCVIKEKLAQLKQICEI